MYLTSQLYISLQETDKWLEWVNESKVQTKENNVICMTLQVSVSVNTWSQYLSSDYNFLKTNLIYSPTKLVLLHDAVTYSQGLRQYMYLYIHYTNTLSQTQHSNLIHPLACIV